MQVTERLFQQLGSDEGESNQNGCEGRGKEEAQLEVERQRQAWASSNQPPSREVRSFAYRIMP